MPANPLLFEQSAVNDPGSCALTTTITLRDIFAAVSMKPFDSMFMPPTLQFSEVLENRAKCAYAQADAILAERDRLVAVDTTRECALREALEILYAEQVDYITINHLGDPHHNHSMKLARAALGLEKSEDRKESARMEDDAAKQGKGNG